MCKKGKTISLFSLKGAFSETFEGEIVIGV